MLKKLGDLSPPTMVSDDDPLNQVAQHFDRPLTKEKMVVIQTLVEFGRHKKKKDTHSNVMSVESNV